MGDPLPMDCSIREMLSTKSFTKDMVTKMIYSLFTRNNQNN
jgi:hypothetical protein